MATVYEKRISDRIEGIFPPATQAAFNVDAAAVQKHNPSAC